jgi:hypothetical protein
MVLREYLIQVVVVVVLEIISEVGEKVVLV